MYKFVILIIILFTSCKTKETSNNTRRDINTSLHIKDSMSFLYNKYDSAFLKLSSENNYTINFKDSNSIIFEDSCGNRIIKGIENITNTNNKNIVKTNIIKIDSTKTITNAKDSLNSINEKIDIKDYSKQLFLKKCIKIIGILFILGYCYSYLIR